MLSRHLHWYFFLVRLTARGRLMFHNPRSPFRYKHIFLWLSANWHLLLYCFIWFCHCHQAIISMYIFFIWFKNCVGFHLSYRWDSNDKYTIRPVFWFVVVCCRSVLLISQPLSLHFVSRNRIFPILRTTFRNSYSSMTIVLFWLKF